MLAKVIVLAHAALLLAFASKVFFQEEATFEEMTLPTAHYAPGSAALHFIKGLAMMFVVYALQAMCLVFSGRPKTAMAFQALSSASWYAVHVCFPLPTSDSTVLGIPVDVAKLMNLLFAGLGVIGFIASDDVKDKQKKN